MVHVRRRYLLVQHTLPAEGSVLSRKMPTKRKLPGSSLITGAYVHTFELRDGGVSVLVALHVQVRKEQQLQNTTKWRMKPLPVPKSNTVHFTLTPVSKNTPVDILAIDLMLDEDSPRRAHLVFTATVLCARKLHTTVAPVASVQRLQKQNASSPNALMMVTSIACDRGHFFTQQNILTHV